jgi:cytochrome c biogenesis protein CcdA
MLAEFLGRAGEYVHHSPYLALLAVFVGGLLTACAPCVLAMIPLMMSFVAGHKDLKVGPLRAFVYSLIFVLGLSITFTALGVVAALAGSLYGEVSSIWNWVVAAVCLVMGLHLIGLLKLTIPVPFQLQPRTRGIAGALFMGLLFGLVSMPCAGPILVVLLTYLAGSGASMPYGALLLLIYALGHGVLILVAGTSMGLARRLIESKNITRATDIMRRVAGGVIILLGFFFVYSGLQ